MSKNLMMLGLPGVGKGTNAEVLAKDLKLSHISTGDIFRKAMADGTELGKQAKEFMDAGNLVPDSLTNNIVAERLNQDDIKEADGFILDGFPRNVEQAKFLDDYLASKGTQLDAVIYLEASEKVVVDRLLGRGRADDTQEVIENRIKVAMAETMPLVEFYSEKGNLLTIDATDNVGEVYSRVKSSVESL